MSTSMDALAIRRRLGRERFAVPIPYGTDGWQYDDKTEHGEIFVTCSDHPGFDKDVLHASIAYHHRMPTYDDLCLMHQAVWPNGYAYQLFVPPAFHVNIAEHALHLWGHLDGSPMIPELSLDLSDWRLSLPGVGRITRSV